MKNKEKNQAIKELIAIITTQYPNFTASEKKDEVKLNVLKKILTNKDLLKTFNFVDYSISYVIRNQKYLDLSTLANDIISISLIFEKRIENMQEFSQESMDNYIKIIRNKSYDEIVRLNKILLTQDIIIALMELNNKFENEEEYINYINSILTPAELRYRLKKQVGLSEEAAIESTRSDVRLTIDKAQERVPKYGYLQRKLQK